MLKPGTLVGDALEAGSMALAIEQALVAQGILDLDEEQSAAAETRRKSFIAISTGIIEHLRANLEVVVAANKFSASLPPAETRLLGSAGEVK